MRVRQNERNETKLIKVSERVRRAQVMKTNIAEKNRGGKFSENIIELKR